MMKRRVTAVALAMVLFLSACTGSFNLTRKVNQFNKSFDDPWTEEVVFLGLVIVQVYSISLLADMLVFNAIEFWGGENPVGDEDQQLALADDASATVLADGSIRLEVDDRIYLLEKTDAGVVATGADGEILYRAVTDEAGKISVYDASGKLVRREQ